MSGKKQGLVIGCGYLGKRLADRQHQAGTQVWATTRSEETALDFASRGWEPLLADVTQPVSLKQLPEVEVAVYCVGFDPTSGSDRHTVYADGLSHTLENLPQSCKRFVLISTTGVYGDAGGEEVDEETPCQPMRLGGQAFLEAENRLRQHPHWGKHWGKRGVILRLAGIYGPGRIPRAADIQAGKPIPAPAQGSLNLIHVEDACQAVELAWEADAVSPVYIVADGQPVARREYYREVARLLKAPEPTFETPPADSPAAQRAGADRRMNAERIVRELGFAPKYPSYREGLAAIVGRS
ncbi:MAG: SDR family oxidoreductase [Pirellulaceae bacterium]